MEKKNKKQILVGVLVSLALVFIVVGISFSMYNFFGTGEKELTITSGRLSITYEETDIINLTNQYPKTDSDGIANTEDESEMNFKITTSFGESHDSPIYYGLALTELNDDATLKGSKIKFYLLKEGTVASEFTEGVGKIMSSVKNNTITQPETGTTVIDSYAIHSDVMTGNDEHNYTIKAWIDINYDLPQTDDSNGNVHGVTTTSEEFSFKVKMYASDSPLTLNQFQTNLASTWKNYTTYENAYLAMYTQGELELPATKEYNGVTYTKESEVDVSEQQNGGVLLGTYVNGSNRIAILAQEGRVVAPALSNSLFGARNPQDFNYFNFEYMDLSYFDTSNVTTMVMMFFRNKSTHIKFGESFTTNNVTSMQNMFFQCPNLENLDLTTFNTSNVTNMSMMFGGTGALNQVKVGCNWTTSNATTTYMFNGSGVSEVTRICATE